MQTLGNVRKLIIAETQDFVLFGGGSFTWHNVFMNHCYMLGSAVCEEQSVAREQGKYLPDTIPLGSKSQALALELKAFTEKPRSHCQRTRLA